MKSVCLSLCFSAPTTKNPWIEVVPVSIFAIATADYYSASLTENGGEESKILDDRRDVTCMQSRILSCALLASELSGS